MLERSYETPLGRIVYWVSEKAENPFLRGYVAVLADSTNLKSAVRTL